ncbi:MAG: hypothetical protein ACLGH0_11025, partial [Thermoanaerobaculia bacterium]
LRYDPELELTFGWPLSQKETVTLALNRRKSRLARESEDDEDITLTDRDQLTVLDARYWYETIDDPLFTTSGLSIAAGPRWTFGEHVVQTYDTVTKKVVGTTTKDETWGFALDASAYQPLGSRSAAFLNVSGDAAQNRETEVDAWRAIGRVGLAHNFPLRTRLEVAGGYRIDDHELIGEASFVMRPRWGTVRLTASYEWE